MIPTDDTTGYPIREQYYAHRYTRLLFQSCAAQSLGQHAVLLAIHIAHAEDAAFYQGPVRFWNSQLNEVLGFRSPKTLDNARDRAKEAGWLHYERKHDRDIGKYWTTIPHTAHGYDDPIESSFPVPGTEQKSEQEGYGKRNRKVTGNDPPSNPYPVPNPIPNKRNAQTKFVPPSLEEVTAYCQEIKSEIVPEDFIDYYESNGWRVGAGPMRDWKATVRRWGRKKVGSSQNHKCRTANVGPGVKFNPSYSSEGNNGRSNNW